MISIAAAPRQFQAESVKERQASHGCSHRDPSDCYEHGHSRPLTYSRSSLRQFQAQMGDSDSSSRQMGAGSSFPSAQYTFGTPDSDRDQRQWTAELGSIPKDCYYCRSSWGEITGKCAKDAPEWGSGKDYMGEKCSACSGTGKCPHCGGDGVLG